MAEIVAVTGLLGLSTRLSQAVASLTRIPGLDAASLRYRRVVLGQVLVIENLLSTVLDDGIGAAQARRLREPHLMFDGESIELSSQLRALLGENRESFMDLLADVGQSFAELELIVEKLQKFDRPKWNKLKFFEQPKADEADRHVRRMANNLSDIQVMIQNLIVSRQQLATLQVSGLLDQVNRIEDTEDDASSISSDVTDNEGESEGSNVLCVKLMPIEQIDIQTSHPIEKDALLDTGAQMCCISEQLAEELKAEIVPDDDVELWTVTKQRIFHKGKTKLKVGWKKSSGLETWSRKSPFYVILGIDLPLVLSNYFVTRYKLLALSRIVRFSLLNQIAPILFSRRNPAQRASDAQQLASTAAENAAMEDHDREIRQQALRSRMGLSPTVSGSASTTSTSQTQTNSTTSTTGSLTP